MHWFDVGYGLLHIKDNYRLCLMLIHWSAGIYVDHNYDPFTSRSNLKMYIMEWNRLNKILKNIANVYTWAFAIGVRTHLTRARFTLIDTQHGNRRWVAPRRLLTMTSPNKQHFNIISFSGNRFSFYIKERKPSICPPLLMAFLVIYMAQARNPIYVAPPAVYKSSF